MQMSTGRPATRHCAAAGRWHNRSRGFGGFMLQLQSGFGVLALLAIAWALSENRRAVSLRQMAVGLAATVITALVLLKLPPGGKAVGALNEAGHKDLAR